MIEVWIVVNETTHKLMFYGTRSECDNYKNEVQPLLRDRLKVRLLRIGMTTYEKGEKPKALEKLQQIKALVISKTSETHGFPVAAKIIKEILDKLKEIEA